MFSKAFSAAIHGIDGLIVSVEADVSDGLPLFDMVGYLGSEVKEARERVRIALKNPDTSCLRSALQSICLLQISTRKVLPLICR
jgi:hypothetical protein